MRELFDLDLDSASRRVAAGRFIVPLVVLLLLLGALVWWTGARNPFTPAGYVGYLTKGAVFGQSRFYGIQRGPTSPGRTWLLEVTNVSITPYTYTEDFTNDEAVLSRDNLKIASASTRSGAWTTTQVPLFMERFSTTVSGRDARARIPTRSSRWRTPTSSASRCGRSRATKCSGATASR